MKLLLFGNSSLTEFWLGLIGIVAGIITLDIQMPALSIPIYLYLLFCMIQIVAALTNTLDIRHFTNWISFSSSLMLAIFLFNIDYMKYSLLFGTIALGHLHCSFLTNYLKHILGEYNVGIFTTDKDNNSS